MNRSARSRETLAAVELMKELGRLQDFPMVGTFWYDPDANELFGVSSQISVNLLFETHPLIDSSFRTGGRLHKTIWKKEVRRGNDSRFVGSYDSFPRGRVVEIKDGGYKVYVGDWIDENPGAKEQILDEFQLPEDSTEFIKDVRLIDLIGYRFDPAT